MRSRHLSLDLPAAETHVYLGRGLVDRVGALLRGQDDPSKRAWVMVGPSAMDRFGARVVEGLQSAGYAVTIRVLPSGETTKSLQSAAMLFEEMAAQSMDRSTLVVGLGGGVVCDLAGYVAAGYLRGVPLVLVPTTLLAQVDAAVGGKCAVNVAPGKNNVGTVHHPIAVIVDPSTLADLPGSHLRAGLAEAVKFGAVLDPHFLDELETWGGLAAEGDPDALDRVVSRALELKCRAVLDDPGATGTQEFLHFGHTLAGAIEVTESEGGSLHGEAVAQGMMFALRLGRELGVTSEAAALRLVSVLAGLGLGQDALDIHPTILQRAMIHDKKVRDGRHWFVLLEELGSPVTRSSVEPDLVARVLRAFVTDHSRKLAVCN